MINVKENKLNILLYLENMHILCKFRLPTVFIFYSYNEVIISNNFSFTRVYKIFQYATQFFNNLKVDIHINFKLQNLSLN